MEHVGTIEEHDVFQLQPIIANRTVTIFSFHGQVFLLLPKLRQLNATFRFLFFLSLLDFSVLFGLHHFWNIWQKTAKEFFSVFDVAINLLDRFHECSPLLSHIVNVFFADAAEFVANIPLPQRFHLRFVSHIFHSLVELLPLQKSSDQTLHFDYNWYQEAHLAASECFVIVVFFTAYRTCPFTGILILYFLKWFQALSVEYVGAAKYFLLLNMEVFEANRARVFLFFLGSLQVFLLNFFPFCEAHRDVWTLH